MIMNAPESMSRTVGGKQYSTETATLLAHDNYWDGSNWERNGRNAFLYRTPNGAYFEVHLTQWSDERDTLIPVCEAEAQETFEYLPEKGITWREAFPDADLVQA